jgi:hypothetical protein
MSNRHPSSHIHHRNRSASIRRSHSRSRSPPQFIMHPSRLPSPITFPVIVYDPGKIEDDPKPHVVPPQDPHGSKASLDANADSHSARFSRSQVLQEYQFGLQEIHRTTEFEYAEGKRDEAEIWRTDDFERAEGQHTQKFNTAMRSNEKYYLQTELSRHWAEDLRAQQFSMSQEYHSHMFNEDLSWEKKKDLAMHTSSAEWVAAEKTRIEALGSFYNMVLDQARRHRASVMGQTLSSRRALYVVSQTDESPPILFTPIKPSRPPVIIMQPEHWSRSRSRSKYRHRSSISLSRRRYYGEEARPHRRRYSPPTGFVSGFKCIQKFILY